MEFSQFDGIVWLLLSLGPLIFLQRGLHYEIQAFLLLITRREDVTVAVFSLLFFPGVVLHELSHFGMAKLLLVRTGRVSLLPQQTGSGKLRLGFVETAKTDPLRDTLIGMAPLISGLIVVGYIGLSRFGLGQVVFQAADSGAEAGFQSASAIFQQADFWIWFYLLVVVSSTMLPSPSDRQSWLLIGLWVLGILAVSILAGAGSWLMKNAAPKVDEFLTVIAIIFFISAGVHAILLPIFWGLHNFTSRLTGYKING